MPSSEHTKRRTLSPALAIAFVLGALVGAALPAASRLDRAIAAPAPGLANPADDRSRMIAELQRLTTATEAIRDALSSGRVKVQVVQPDSQAR